MLEVDLGDMCAIVSTFALPRESTIKVVKLEKLYSWHVGPKVNKKVQFNISFLYR